MCLSLEGAVKFTSAMQSGGPRIVMPVVLASRAASTRPSRQSAASRQDQKQAHDARVDDDCEAQIEPNLGKHFPPSSVPWVNLRRHVILGSLSMQRTGRIRPLLCRRR
jgi:hypothetical protein